MLTPPLSLRKTKFLAGSNIYITEDFSKKVKDKRTELNKFMRKMKKRWGINSSSKPNTFFKPKRYEEKDEK